MTGWFPAIGDRRFRWQLAALFLLLAAVVMPPFDVQRRVHDVVAVLDISTSMTVRDMVVDGRPATRLEAGKAALRTLAATLPCGSRLGVALFVEARPFLLFEPVEVCDNLPVLDEEIASLDWRMGWDSESHIEAGVRSAMGEARALDADLLFMTDGQEVPPAAVTGIPDFTPVRGRVRGALVGMGGTALVPIPRYDMQGRQVGVWNPGDLPADAGMFRAHENLSAVDEAHLRDLARRTGLAYTRFGALLPILDADGARKTLPAPFDPAGIIAGFALVLLAISLSRPKSASRSVMTA